MNIHQGKKGQSNSREWLVALILAGVLIVIVLAIQGDTFKSLHKDLNEKTNKMNNDFDGDGLKDNIDESPCIPFGTTVIINRTVEYYSGDDIANCEDDERIGVARDTGQKVCYLPVETCDKYLKEKYANS